jgi:hypothetical protein
VAGSQEPVVEGDGRHTRGGAPRNRVPVATATTVGQHGAAHAYVEHLLGCHRFSSCDLALLAPARLVGGQGPERVLAQMAAAAVRMTSRTLSGWDSMGQWLLSNS